MKYLFSNIMGCTVVDEQHKILEQKSFQTAEQYTDRQNMEKQLHKKYPDLKPLPVQHIPELLALFQEKKYFPEFYTKNIALTKQSIRHSVTDDTLIIQTIANIQELDRISNILSKRLREWYAWYCPEVAEHIADHLKFAETICTRSRKELLQQFKISNTMGMDLAAVHVQEILALAQENIKIFQLRQKHEQYLQDVMQKCCPNLLELAGATIGAKLMELAKGLKNLALLPASTIQLLGAEKALFRHIKTGSRSPKYGWLFQHPFVQNAPQRERGKAARILADKLSWCARLDYFKGGFKAKEYKKELEEKLRRGREQFPKNRE